MKIKLASAYFDINVVNKYTKIDLKLTKTLLTLNYIHKKFKYPAVEGVNANKQIVHLMAILAYPCYQTDLTLDNKSTIDDLSV